MIRSLAILLVGAALAAPVSAQVGDSDLELKIKAAFLFNFAKFVDWGPVKSGQPEEPIRICIVGRDPFGPILDETVRDKRIGTHPLEVRRPTLGASLRECHMLYTAAHDPTAINAAFEGVTGAGVMTIHEADAPLAAGVARLYLEQNRVRFEINMAAAEREHLQISSKLLSVASVVQR